MDLLTNQNSVKLGGKEWFVSPLTVQDLSELQTWVYSKLEDPIAVAREIAKDMPEAVAKEILLVAYEDVRSGARKLGSVEATNLLRTFEGFVEMVYLHCRKNHPEMTRESWSNLLTSALEDDIKALNAKLKEEEGGAIPDPKAPSSSAETGDPSIGGSTSGTSPKTSNGRRKKSAN